MKLSQPMPKSLPSTESRFSVGLIDSLKMASSDSVSRSRGPTRSIGVSFMPSGIQRLVTHGLPSALPIAAPMRRHAMPWLIQNVRIAWSAWDSVMLSAAFGCEK